MWWTVSYYYLTVFCGCFLYTGHVLHLGFCHYLSKLGMQAESCLSCLIDLLVQIFSQSSTSYHITGLGFLGVHLHMHRKKEWQLTAIPDQAKRISGAAW